MRKLTWTLAFCVTFAIFGVGVCGEDRKLPRESSVESAIQELFRADNYRKLENVVKKWRKEVPEKAQKDILIGLLRNLGSEKPLKLVGAPKVYVVGVPRNPDEDTKDSVTVVQDVYTEGGRSAWAIAQLLEIQLGEKRGEDRYRPIVEAVIKRMNMPIIGRFDNLPVAERLALARANAEHTNDTFRMFRQLAKDSNVEVRIAVASNPSVHPFILGEFLNDPDENVRLAARQNRRTFSSN